MRDSFLDDDIDIKPVRRRSTSHRKSNDDVVRTRSRNRDYEDAGLPTELIKYVALAIFVIVTAVCGAKFVELSFPIVLVTLVIVIVMGVLLHNTPVFVSILLGAAIMIAGMVTGNTDLILCAITAYFATNLTFKS